MARLSASGEDFDFTSGKCPAEDGKLGPKKKFAIRGKNHSLPHRPQVQVAESRRRQRGPAQVTTASFTIAAGKWPASKTVSGKFPAEDGKFAT